MDCLIRVIEGPDKGAEVALPPGSTLIGRGPKAQLRLSAEGVSYEHAVVTRSGEEYSIENLSASGTFVDDTKVTGSVKLRPRGMIRLDGETVLRLESTAGETGMTGQRLALLVSLVGVLLIALVVVAINPFKAPTPADDWGNAFAALYPWAQVQAKGHHLPTGTDSLFVEAWTLERAEDFQRSQRLWLRLQLLLDSAENHAGLQESAQAHPGALTRLLHSTGHAETLTDEEMGAALVQFAYRRLKWSTAKNNPAKK